jgi:TorA maturation chaperone TorD
MSSTYAISDSQVVVEMPDSDKQSLAIARCNAFHVLSRAFDLPGNMDDDDPRLLRITFRALDKSLHTAAHRAAREWQEAVRDRDPLSVAYARLFLGPFEIMAPPYASLYLDPERRLMGQISVDVARRYAKAGLGPGAGPNEAPDHVTRELEFMYYLAFREINDDDRAWVKLQRDFWLDHLQPWMQEFAKNIAEAHCHPFYDALADLLASFCDVENAGWHFGIGKCGAELARRTPGEVSG